MGIRAVSNTSTVLPVGGRWLIEVVTTDDNGCLTDGAPTVAVTLPAGTVGTATFSAVSTGYYRAAYTVTTVGRYIARVATASNGVIDFAAFSSMPTSGIGMPTVVDVAVYLGQTSVPEDTMQDALDAEAAAQRAVCRVGAIYGADLRQALLRRVQRNLALRQLPLAVPQGDADLSAGFVPRIDPEIRRLEGPYRKLVIG